MRSQVAINTYAHQGHFVGTRHTAQSVRESIEQTLLNGGEVEFDFSRAEVTQSFVDELVGVLILRHGPQILDRLIFKSCSDSARAIIEFVAADRCDQYIKRNSH